ncbi:MAG: porin, partial [Pseudolabrys sp.]
MFQILGFLADPRPAETVKTRQKQNTLKRRLWPLATSGLSGVATAKPVQYVKICSLYGAGFYYMPGTDT